MQHNHTERQWHNNSHNTKKIKLMASTMQSTAKLAIHRPCCGGLPHGLMTLSCDLSHLSRRMWFDRRLVMRLALAAWLAGVRRQITFACERERTYVNSVRWRLSKVDECNSTAIHWMNFDFHGWLPAARTDYSRTIGVVWRRCWSRLETTGVVWRQLESSGDVWSCECCEETTWYDNSWVSSVVGIDWRTCKATPCTSLPSVQESGSCPSVIPPYESSESWWSWEVVRWRLLYPRGRLGRQPTVLVRQDILNV